MMAIMNEKIGSPARTTSATTDAAPKTMKKVCRAK